MKTGRNERCPCGSGKKYKACHGAVAAEQKSKGTLAMVIVGGAIALGLGAFAWGMVEDTGADSNRVWSEEHGHWHGPDGRELGAVGNAPAPSGSPTGAPVPPPPGEAPPGKVWSAEHGHWHDA